MIDLVPDGLYTIHRRMHRLLGRVGDRVMLIDVADHRFHLVQQEDGTIGLPSIGKVRRMLATDEMRRVDPIPAANVDIERLDAEVGLLEAAGVRNGEKAIAIFMHAVWDDDLRRRFGDHDEPATIRKWRTARRKALKEAGQQDRSDA